MTLLADEPKTNVVTRATTPDLPEPRFVVIGGGPAGLTAGYELLKHGVKPIVLEKAGIVGGIARTESYKGYRFDMGGHRFFTKSDEVNALWHEVLSDEFLERPRLSRIFYNGRFFPYPLKPVQTLQNLGVIESGRILVSYVRWRLVPHRVEESFEQWVTNRFGDRLFRTFFKTYTEKVWGIPCSELKAEWAAQRIKDLSLKTAVLSMFFSTKDKIKTLIEKFHYPRLGPGMLWETVQRKIDTAGGEVRMRTRCVRLPREGSRLTGVEVEHDDGSRELIPATHVISSMPVTEFIAKLDPPPPQHVRDAAGRLKYRDFLTVCLIIDKPDLFPDNWIYIHDPTVKVGRIQNFGNWSPDLVPEPGRSCLGLEYFCNEGDDLWSMRDEDLVSLGTAELDRIGLANAADVVDGCVHRVEKSYPVYDGGYAESLETVKAFIESLENTETIGRNGLHRYNNQDHSMLTGLYAVRNLLDGQTHDLWEVNADKAYHEEVRPGDSPAASGADDTEALEREAVAVFGRIDRTALGTACGVVLGLMLSLATLILLIKGGDPVGPTLSLLGQYLPGYRVSLAGVLLGGAYGLIVGFLVGWLLGAVRNGVTFLYWVLVRRRAERAVLRRMLDFV